MPAHARPRPALVSRPGTVTALGLTVTVLTITALLHAPASANADEPTTVAEPSVTATGPEPQLHRFAETRISDAAARLEARVERIERQARREQRQRREARQERRAEARAAARAARRPVWVMPVPGAGWSASFGEAGSMWSSGYHTGQDFTAPSGTPVHAVGPGTITSATWSDAYGNVLVITHPDGSESWYAHMSGFERTSGTVAPGDVIGYVGCTGNCFGTHLHFEYRPGGGESADPLPWLHAHGAY